MIQGAKGSLLVRFPQQALQAQQYAPHIIHCAPLILQNIQTDPAREIDIRVVYWRREQNRWWRIRVILREGEGEFEG